MKILVVQKRLPYVPESLDRQAGVFLKEVEQLIRKAREQHGDGRLELADIGFIPGAKYIEVKLYFRPAARETADQLVRQ